MQTTFSTSLAALEPGMIPDDRPVESLNGYNAEATDEIPFGVAVQLSTGNTGMTLLDAAGNLVWGVTAYGTDYSPATSSAPQLGDDGVLPDGHLRIVRKGPVAVRVEETVSPGDRAFVRFANGAVETGRGTFRKSQEVIAGPANSCIDLTAVAVFETGASAGGIAIVNVDFVNEP